MRFAQALALIGLVVLVGVATADREEAKQYDNPLAAMPLGYESGSLDALPTDLFYGAYSSGSAGEMRFAAPSGKKAGVKTAAKGKKASATNVAGKKKVVGKKKVFRPGKTAKKKVAKVGKKKVRRLGKRKASKTGKKKTVVKTKPTSAFRMSTRPQGKGGKTGKTGKKTYSAKKGKGKTTRSAKKGKTGKTTRGAKGKTGKKTHGAKGKKKGPSAAMLFAMSASGRYAPTGKQPARRQSPTGKKSTSRTGGKKGKKTRGKKGKKARGKKGKKARGKKGKKARGKKGKKARGKTGKARAKKGKARAKKGVQKSYRFAQAKASCESIGNPRRRIQCLMAEVRQIQMVSGIAAESRPVYQAEIEIMEATAPRA